MTTTSVLTAIAPSGVATITFNRPDIHNAIDETLIAQFKGALQEMRANPAARVVVIAGNGKSFCAGADLNWMKRTSNYDAEQNYRDALEFTELLALLDAMPQPTIARVHGPAYGGGVGIVAACDIALGASEALFAFSEVRLGLIPAMISPYAVAAIGERYARRYMLSAERIDAAQAYRIGLLHEVCAAAELDGRIEALAAQLRKNGPAAMAACKRLVATVARGPIDAAMRATTAREIATLRASAEGKEGVGAFLDKRAPAWIAADEGAKG